MALGGAVPPNWSTRVSRSAEVYSSKSGSPMVGRTAVDLVQNGSFGDLVSRRAWKVRDQSERGTCTAFAVVAAEELYRRPQQDAAKPEFLSEEHLYAAIRSTHPRDDAGVAVTDDQIAKNNKDGSTYLAQAREALINQGLCARELMEYEDEEDIAYYVKDIPSYAVEDAALRKIARTELVHNIIDIDNGNLPPYETTWINTLQTPLADVFWLQLSQGIPIVASFAILDIKDWFEGIARDWGEVKYHGVQDGTPEGGHTVCLTGYVPPVDGDTVSGGWFQFRNSLGSRFAKEFDRDPYEPIVIATGYGHISAKDVNTYCWEYLHRASPP